MHYPKAYIEYLIQFHATRDYFECHELLEEYWKDNPQDGLGELWVACIQIAVAQYHERRSKRRGAMLMYQSALHKLTGVNSRQIGLDHDQLLLMLETRAAACTAGKAYVDLSLPIIDQQLLADCKKEAATRGYAWARSSKGLPDEIIHRHTKRDRSAVIAARSAALDLKKLRR